LKYTGELSINTNDIKELKSNLLFINSNNYSSEEIILNKLTVSINNVIKDDIFLKKYTSIIKHMQILVYNHNKMIISTWSTSNNYVGGKKYLFELKKNILTLYQIDNAGGHFEPIN
jgi:hypothetical protein